MDKFIKITTFLLLLIDSYLRFIQNSQNYSFLVKPILRINILEIFILLAFIYFAYRLLPYVKNRINMQNRSKHFACNWEKYKKTLLDYERTKNGALQTIYEELRKKIIDDLYFFGASIQKSQTGTHRNNTTEMIRLLEEGLQVNKISDWGTRMSSRIGINELHVFDPFINGLKEYYKNPENYKNI